METTINRVPVSLYICSKGCAHGPEHVCSYLKSTLLETSIVAYALLQLLLIQHEALQNMLRMAGHDTLAGLQLHYEDLL